MPEQPPDPRCGPAGAYCGGCNCLRDSCYCNPNRKAYMEWLEKNEEKKFRRQEFIKYVLGFYSVGGVYEDMFDPPVTREEVVLAVKIREEHNDPPCDFDSFDREMVRDIIFANRGKTEDLEYSEVVDWVNK